MKSTGRLCTVPGLDEADGCVQDVLVVNRLDLRGAAPQDEVPTSVDGGPHHQALRLGDRRYAVPEGRA